MQLLPFVGPALLAGVLLVQPTAAQGSCGGTPLCPERARCIELGPGCAPAGMRRPELTSAARPAVGSTARVVIDSPSTPRAMTLLTIGYSSTFNPTLGIGLPFDLSPLGFTSCSMYSSGDAGIVPIMLDCDGEHEWRIRVPERAKWCGAPLVFQALILGPNTTAGSAEVLVSNGLACSVGN
jgi:hypothetical protein